MLPSGYISAFTATGVDTGPGWGWAALLLDHLEETSIRGLVHFNLPIEDAANDPVRMLQIAVYLCPSDPAPPSWPALHDDPSQSKIRDIASANYVGMYGDSEPGVDGRGLFFRNSGIRLREVTDGTSQTIAVGERSHALGESTWVGSVTGALFGARPGRRHRHVRSRARLDDGARPGRRAQKPWRSDWRSRYVPQPAPGRCQLRVRRCCTWPF